jgi:hypothetical protein
MVAVVLAAVAFAVSQGTPRPGLLAALILGCLSVMGLLLTAIMAAIYRRGPTRAFWIGFSLFGWMSFAWVLFILSNSPPWPEPVIPLLLLGVPPYAWLGGSIARKVALSAAPPKEVRVEWRATEPAGSLEED